jgi:hypothetical protein
MCFFIVSSITNKPLPAPKCLSIKIVDKEKMMVVLNLQPVLPLTDDVFEQLCRQNPDLRLERTAQGELIAMAPADSETGILHADLLGQLWRDWE